MVEQRTEGLDADKKVVELPPVKRYELADYICRIYNWVVTLEVVDEDGNVVKPEVRTSYRIEKPVAFWWAPGHTTHRVLDAEGFVHVVPAPKVDGCAMKYKKIDGAEPVTF